MESREFSASSRLRTDFDLGRNLARRPFLFEINGSLGRIVTFRGRRVRISVGQEGRKLTIRARGASVRSRADMKELARKVRWCLGAEEDLFGFYSLCEDDPVLGPLLPQLRGLRIFSAPSDWEGLACIICSQMTAFPQYKRIVYSLYSAYGGRFPSQGDVLRRPGLLAGCGLGYRAAFLLGCAKRFRGDAATEEGLPGIGPYSRSIFSLFARRDFSRVYDDVLIRRILKERYRGRSLDGFARRWGPWAGIAEVYLQKFLADQKRGG